MNPASQNFPHHLGVLRERMLHPTGYEYAVNYFLEEFAGDVAFVKASEPEPMPHLVAVFNIVVSKDIGPRGSGKRSGVVLCEHKVRPRKRTGQRPYRVVLLL
jgi:hypothetical protein